MLTVGFHYSVGGNKGGSGDYITKMNVAGLPVMMKGASDAGLCFEAQEKGEQYGVENLLVWRATSDREDRADYWLAPSVAAAKKWGEIKDLWPPELNPELVWWEVINEPRKEDAPDEVQPTWNGLHTTAWLGLFMVEMAKLMNPAGFKLCGPSFSSGEPGNAGEEVDVWMLEGMATWLRYCAENPEMAAVSVHEYCYDGLVPFDQNYPFHYGRFQAVIAAADRLGIPRTFKILVTEFGWTYEWVPSFEEAEPILRAYMELCAKFPQVQGVALWTLQVGWGGISDKLAQWINNQGNPLADWLITNQIPDTTEPQPTDPAFGGTLPMPTDPTEPPIDPPNPDPDPSDGLPGIVIKTVGGEKNLTIQALAEDGSLVAAWFLADMANVDQLVVEVEYEGDLPPIDPPDPDPDPIEQPPSPAPGDWFTDLNANRIKVNWNGLEANGFKKVGLRTSNGLGTDTTDASGVDKMLWGFIEQVRVRKFAYDLYHFMNKKAPIEVQIDLFISIIAKCIGEVGWFPEVLYLDFEGDTSPSTEADIEKSFRYLHTTLTAVGLPVGVNVLKRGAYSSATWWNPKVSKNATWPAELGLQCWSAYYTSATPPMVIPGATFRPPVWNGFSKVDQWQFTSSGGAAFGQTTDPALDVNYQMPLDDVPVSTKFKIGDVVKVTANALNVRVTPGGDSLGTQAKDAIGTVIGGPVYANSYHRWQVDFTNAPDGWCAETWLEAVPQVVIPTLVGLHASADGGAGAAPSLEPAEFEALKPGVVKFLTINGPELISPIMQKIDVANCVFVVRPFLSWGGRNITPDQFFNDTVNDFERTVNVLKGFGVKDEKIFGELHNEPNLTIEGWTYSWGDGKSFATWGLSTLNLYKARFPGIKWMFPGLSPGAAIPALRTPAQQFLIDAKPFVDACDALGVHAYWAANDPRSNALAWIDWNIAQHPNKLVFVTEASYKSPASGDLVGNEYFQFVNGLNMRPNVGGVTFYVASASNAEYYNEVWVRDGKSRGIATTIRGLIGS